jgi:hypothetical protein
MQSVEQFAQSCSALSPPPIGTLVMSTSGVIIKATGELDGGEGPQTASAVLSILQVNGDFVDFVR